MAVFDLDLQRLLERKQGSALRLLDQLPKIAQTSLIKALGYPDSYPKLDPFTKCLLAIKHKQGYSGLIGADIQRSRQEFESTMQAIKSEATSVAWVEDLKLDLPSGTLFARHYHPAPRKKLPLIMFYHGGGFVMGGIESHDEVCRLLAVHSKAQVLSIDYPLAPEASPQRIVQSCLEALIWIYQQREHFKIYKNRLAVAGDSAGGNLATVVAQQSIAQVYAPQAQLLLYPTVDFKSRHRSFYAYQHGLILTAEDVDQVTEFYVTQHQLKLDDPLVSPTYGQLKQVAAAFIVTAGHDLLRDEAEIYLHKLRQQSVNVAYQHYPEQSHGFANLTPVSQRAKKELIEVAKKFRRFWDQQH